MNNLNNDLKYRRSEEWDATQKDFFEIGSRDGFYGKDFLGDFPPYLEGYLVGASLRENPSSRN